MPNHMPNHHDPIPPTEEQSTVRQPAARFGTLLRDLRESYFTRVAKPRTTSGPAPRLKLSAQSLVDCMQEAGYPISPPTYSLIENGTNLPKNVAGFLRAVRSCLDLSDADYSMLLYLLTYDLVYPRLGELADSVLRPESLLADTLSVWRRIRGVTVDELARGLIACGFVPAEAPAPEMLAMYVARMEQGARWPFDESQIPAFVSAYARFVSDHAAEAVGKALAEESRLAQYIRNHGDASAKSTPTTQ
jgi:hypothetical protein